MRSASSASSAWGSIRVRHHVRVRVMAQWRAHALAARASLASRPECRAIRADALGAWRTLAELFCLLFRDQLLLARLL